MSFSHDIASAVASQVGVIIALVFLVGAGFGAIMFSIIWLLSA